jgi:hypothetical protein
VRPETDAFDAATALHQYHRAARELSRFCESGLHVEMTEGVIQLMAEQGDEIDWWARGEPRQREEWRSLPERCRRAATPSASRTGMGVRGAAMGGATR